MKAKVTKIMLAAIVFLIYLWFSAFMGFGCPIKYVIGFPCPTCGMTRAWFCALHLNFRDAFFYHPLFFTAPLLILFIIFKDSRLFGKISAKIKNTFIIGCAILIFIVYIVRLNTGLHLSFL